LFYRPIEEILFVVDFLNTVLEFTVVLSKLHILRIFFISLLFNLIINVLQKKKKHHIFSDSALQLADDIFTVAVDYDMDDDEEEDEVSYFVLLTGSSVIAYM